MTTPRTPSTPETAAPVAVSGARLALLVTAVAVVALNLRPAVTTVGPVLDRVTGYFGTGDATAGVITALPVFAFAVVSLATPLLLARISLRAGLFVALVVIALSVAARPWTGLAGFVVGTFVSAVGIGLLAVLLPAVIRSTGRAGVLVTTFTTSLQAGSAAGFAAVVPLSGRLGGWQWGLAAWALLAVAGVLALAVSGLAPGGTGGGARVRAENPFTVLRRTGTGRLAVFFGLQALVAFVVIGWLPSVLGSAGVDAATAGLYLGLMTVLAVPISFVVPPFVARSAHPARWLAGFSVCTVLGVLAFLVAPGAAPLLWTLVLGVGLAVFSLALTVITVSASSADQVVGVSSAVQGTGYVIAALGPFAVGVVRDLSSGWSVPLAVLLAVAVLQVAFACTVRAASPTDRKAVRS